MTATVNIKVTSLCAAGNHAVVDLTKSGQTRQVNISVAEMNTALTNDDIEAFARVALKLAKEGRTLAQLRTMAQAGFDVSVP